MTKELATDKLWEVIEPLLPEERRNLTVAGHASTTGQLSPASCSS
jgi:hypothetical protein